MRSDIATQCVEPFAREGYERVSMRRIAEEVGVSTGTLYHYFPNKAALFEEVVRVASAQDVAEGTQLLLAGFPNPVDRVRPLLRYVAGQRDRMVAKYRVLLEFSAQVHDHEAWSQSLRRARESYLAAVKTVLEVEDDARIEIVLLTILGLVLREMAGDETTDIDAVADQLRALVYGERQRPDFAQSAGAPDHAAQLRA